MCKIVAMAGIRNSKNAWKFIIAAKQFMSEKDNDGIGYAAFTPQGDLYSEKWLKPKDAFINRSAASPETQEYYNRYPGMVEGGETEYLYTGVPTNTMSAIVYHARMATCERGVHNAHPFVQNETALIHNGVISNHKDFKKSISNCDSEALLTSYLEKRVPVKFDELTNAMFPIQGYFACAVLTKDDSFRPVMDLFRDSLAPITITHVPALGCDVFCTSAEIVQKACKKLKWAFHAPVSLKDCTGIRIDALTGKVLDKCALEDSYTSSGYSYNYQDTGYNSKVSSISDNRPSPKEVVDNDAFERGYCWVCERSDALLRKSGTCSLACESEGDRITHSYGSSAALEAGEIDTPDDDATGDQDTLDAITKVS